ncbi:MAG: histidinol-phosphatase [Pseudomonadota bacterium]
MPSPIASSLPSSDLIRVANALADAARPETLRHFRAAEQGLESKGDDFDPVTDADRGAERAMRALLARERPDDAILGEEFPDVPGTTGLTWVLDPIDGTRGYIAGTPTWGVLIAVSDATGPILGVVDQPYIGERFLGGLGAAQVTGPLGERELGARKTASLDEAILFTTFPEVGTPADRVAFERVAARAKLTRYGMDCYAYALIAAGQVDLVIETGLQPYDICAPIAVIEAAGGIVTDWDGKPAHGGGRALAASNPEIHAQALDLLRP